MRTNTQSVAATEIKNRFGDYLREVMTHHKPLLVEKHGKPVAVLLEYHQWRDRDSSKPSWVEQCRLYAESLKRHKRKRTHSVVELINKIREEES